MNATVMCERSIKPTNDDLFMNKRVAQKIELSPAFYPVQPLKGVMMSFFFFFSICSADKLEGQQNLYEQFFYKLT